MDGLGFILITTTPRGITTRPTIPPMATADTYQAGAGMVIHARLAQRGEVEECDREEGRVRRGPVHIFRPEQSAGAMKRSRQVTCGQKARAEEAAVVSPVGPEAVMEKGAWIREVGEAREDPGKQRAQGGTDEVPLRHGVHLRQKVLLHREAPPPRVIPDEDNRILPHPQARPLRRQAVAAVRGVAEGRVTAEAVVAAGKELATPVCIVYR